MFQKIPYSRFQLLHQPSGKIILDAHENSIDVVLRRIQSLRDAGNNMRQYMISERKIRYQIRINDGIVQRRSHPREDRHFTVADFENQHSERIAA